MFFSFEELSSRSQKLERWCSWEMFGATMNLITTAIGFGMSATFIVFVCARIICGRIRGAESRQMFEIESRIDPEQVFLILRNMFMFGKNCFSGYRHHWDFR